MYYIIILLFERCHQYSVPSSLVARCFEVLNGPFRQINGQPPDPRDIDDLFIRIDQLIEDVRRDDPRDVRRLFNR